MKLLRKPLIIELFQSLVTFHDPSSADFFFYDYLKSKVYANSQQTTAVFKNNIRYEIARISQETLKNVMEMPKIECVLASKIKVDIY